MMKRFYLFPLLTLVLGTASAQSSEDQPYQTKTFTGNLSNVRVDVSGGSIQVEGGSSSDVKVEMYVRLNNWPANKIDKAEIEKQLAEYELSMKTEGSSVVVYSRRKSGVSWNSDRNISVSFKIFTPRTFATDLRTSGGSIRLAHLDGPQQFQTSGGSLHMSDVAGLIQGRTSGGSIHLNNCRKEMNVQTSGGSIHAEDLEGKITLKTSGGSVRLTRLNGTIEATTSGGSVQGDAISGELYTKSSGGSIRLYNLSAAVEAETSAGSLDVEFAKLSKYVKLRCSAGSIKVRLPENQGVDLAVRGSRIHFPLAKFRGEADDTHVDGKLNGGGVPLTIHGSNSVSIQ
ncbi:DUF4097 family beta strand repeat-containing protein [Siphonobacter curvatus]|uniref:DUF4097 domain-containing protein n=1 Tax=Siphonobacter curvatus TaxID=2094562 RepID=A0A2S7IRX4_9BACT|nr:DUF4097 family beta strand repeat-containing protein [Siphonobacter curvatus]PQA60432.1 hypothetical protein C5O19_12680 [Siphonobacter curvatus]